MKSTEAYLPSEPTGRPGSLSLKSLPLAFSERAKIELVPPDVPVEQNPRISDHLRQGWQIKSTAQRVVEGAGPRVLVIMTRELP